MRNGFGKDCDGRGDGRWRGSLKGALYEIVGQCIPPREGRKAFLTYDLSSCRSIYEWMEAFSSNAPSGEILAIAVPDLYAYQHLVRIWYTDHPNNCRNYLRKYIFPYGT
jgi:hypothetical protein